MSEEGAGANSAESEADCCCDGTDTESGAAVSVEELRQLVDQLRAVVEKEPWFRGIGIGRDEQGLTLRLNVAPSEAGASTVPETFGGQRIEIVEIEGYEPRD